MAQCVAEPSVTNEVSIAVAYCTAACGQAVAPGLTGALPDRPCSELLTASAACTVAALHQCCTSVHRQESEMSLQIK